MFDQMSTIITSIAKDTRWGQKYRLKARDLELAMSLEPTAKPDI